MSIHKSVLKKEVLELLNVKPDGTYADLTLGAGGYSLSILENLKEGELVCFDLEKRSTDEFINAIKEQKFIIEAQDPPQVFLKKGKISIRVINDNFDSIAKYTNQEFDGIVADLGWSSDQLDSIPGLSYSNDLEELDMRFDKKSNVKASDLLNVLTKKQLKKMFEKYADIYGKQNDNIVSMILHFRKKQLFITVGDVKQALNLHLPTHTRGDALIARVFQALRISVNRELSILEESIPVFFELLKKGGVLAIVAFHSGESKIITQKFNELQRVGRCKFIVDRKESENGVPVARPSVEELRDNLRARSAKLFALQKI